MPIYEYQCQNCGHQLEAFQSFSDAALTDCPKCGQPTLNKLVSATSFQLKGTGWYATDIKNKGKPTSDSTDSKDTSKPSDKSSNSDDSAV